MKTVLLEEKCPEKGRISVKDKEAKGGQIAWTPRET